GSPARRGDVPIVWRTPYGRNCRSPGGSSTTSCPDAAVRVVSPHGLRYRMAYDADLLSPVMRIFSRLVFQSLRKRASEFGIPRGQCGSVTFVQRFGSALNLHPHGHSGVRSRPRTLILKSWNSSSSIETPSVFTWKAELGCRLDSSFSDKSAKARDYQTQP